MRCVLRDALEGLVHIGWHLGHPIACWRAAQALSEAQRAEAEDLARIRWAKALEEAKDY